MKQMILCKECEGELREKYPNENPYPGEHVKFVSGTAIADLLCDSCAKETKIAKGAECCAFSIWATYGGVPYYPWEKFFIKVNR